MKHTKAIEVYGPGSQGLYDKFMETYLNSLEESTQKAFSDFFEMLKLKNGHKVLEVGFGTGINLAFYPDHIHLKGIDITPQMLETAKRKSDELKRINVEYTVYNGHDIPFDANQFDVVLETFALCGSENPEKLFEEMVRVCKPGGLIGVFDYRKQDPKFMIGCYVSNKPDLGILKDQILLADTMKHQGILYEGKPAVVFNPLLELERIVEESSEKHNLRRVDKLVITHSFMECLGRYVLQK